MTSTERNIEHDNEYDTDAYEMNASRDFFSSDYGSQEEWDALTAQQREAQWETFHEKNAQGTADEMRFYKVMITQHLSNYVGD